MEKYNQMHFQPLQQPGPLELQQQETGFNLVVLGRTNESQHKYIQAQLGDAKISLNVSYVLSYEHKTLDPKALSSAVKLDGEIDLVDLREESNIFEAVTKDLDSPSVGATPPHYEDVVHQSSFLCGIPPLTFMQQLASSALGYATDCLSTIDQSLGGMQQRQLTSGDGATTADVEKDAHRPKSPERKKMD